MVDIVNAQSLGLNNQFNRVGQTSIQPFDNKKSPVGQGESVVGESSMSSAAEQGDSVDIAGVSGLMRDQGVAGLPRLADGQSASELAAAVREQLPQSSSLNWPIQTNISGRALGSLLS